MGKVPLDISIGPRNAPRCGSRRRPPVASPALGPTQRTSSKRSPPATWSAEPFGRLDSAAGEDWASLLASGGLQKAKGFFSTAPWVISREPEGLDGQLKASEL